MTVLITGGAGFIGSNVSRLLLKEGYRVVILDDLSTGLIDNIPTEAIFYKRSVTEDLSDIFFDESPKWVIHMAAQVSVSKSLEAPDKDAKINLLGGLRVLQEAVRCGTKKVVYASSAAVYGNPVELPLKEEHVKNPLSPYGISKYTFESYLRSYYENFGLDYTVLRYANVYGPGQLPGADGGVVAVFLDAIKRDETLQIHGDGNQTRDFVYVEDAAMANLLALNHGSGEVFNIGYGSEISINELFQTIGRLTKMNLKYSYQDERPGDIKRSLFSSHKANEVLGFTARYSLTDGLTRTLKQEGLL
ncbi:NAD-dependent epimerase/dehydratase family protein [Natranaerobius trueperi]|uniref:UDP-glucose 4-epimerase n=1 Tax=Natranaerobius trueperi TaxID=759412 RepID=A0A226C3G0_9FIRM|nr:NAD-dependent epimerase/dehydratase family protein [Natranaerobius trueperi]OWZ84967.1 UDP-glucose 4-epimerase [Natranaerobius trueperi]